MSDVKHTPDPWNEIVPDSYYGEGIARIQKLLECADAEAGTECSDIEWIETKRRIVACMDACAGIPTEKLEGRTIAEYVSDEAYLQGMQPSSEGLSVGLSGLACQMLASSFAGQFVGSGAVNYIEVHMEHPEVGDFSVTIQRKHGKTPGQMKAEVENQRDQLKASLDKLVDKAVEIEQQRDQLLDALEACLSDDFDTQKPNCKTWHIREQAKAAIAAVKGEK